MRHRVTDARSFIRELWRECEKDRVSGLSAEVAFYGILSLFPALLAVAGLLGILQGVTGGDVADRAEEGVVGFLERVLTSEASETVDSVRQLFAETRPGILTFGALTAIWAMSRGFAALIRALDIAYGVKEGRSWLRIRLTGLAMGLSSLVTAVILLGMVVLGPLLGTGNDVADSLGAGPFFATAWDWFRIPLVGIALLVWATTVFHFGPANHPTPWRWELPGAFATALLAGLSSLALRIYLGTASGGNQVFGVLGGALVVLLWMYLMGASLLVGAEVNSMLADRWMTKANGADKAASDGVESSTDPTHELAGLGDVPAVE